MTRFIFALLITSLSAAGSSGNGAVPLFFVANHGQAPADVRFIGQGAGLTVYFSPREIRFRVGRDSVRMRLEGTNPAQRLEGLDRQPGQVNFLIGRQEQWRVGESAFGGVAYRQIYRGIDMIYEGRSRSLKSEFIVAPGADPAQIRIRYAGASAVRIDERGGLAIPVAGRELRDEAPYLYQEKPGARITIDGHFRLAADGTVGIAVGGYDRSLPLVIDPVVYSTLLGGSSADAAMAVAVDAGGSAYVAGYTASTNFPILNPVQSATGGSNDVFVAKLNASGNGLVYCTYLGGRGDDRAYGIAIDSAGAAYVTGSTTSTAFPLHFPIQSKLQGARNAFVVKLSPAGNSLVYGTYLGGSASDTGYGIAVDSGGNAYVTGDTTSANFPTTTFQRTNHGGIDVFAAKLNAAGSQLLYSTYLGGTYDDHGAAIAVDSAGAAHVTGSTYSADFPQAGAWQNHNAGGQDAFVAKLDPTGSGLLFGTYLGGTGGSLGYPEMGQGIALDGAGNVYVTGATSSADFPVAQAVQSSRLGWLDAFISKFNASGMLQYSTYLGGSGVDSGNAIAVDAGGSIFVAGQTLSTNLTATNAFQTVSGGEYDAFVARLSAAGDSISLLSYLGGGGSDTATALALDSSGALYVAGWTQSVNFPVLGGYQSVNAGSYGAFVTKISLGNLPATGGVTPNSGSGASQSFSFQFSDAAGAANLTMVATLLNTSAATAGGCSVQYVRAANTLALLTDTGTAPTSNIMPGSGSQQNSQCTLNGAASSVSVSGNTLTLNLSFTFQSAFDGVKNIYSQASNPSGSTGWQLGGSFTVIAGPPVPVSVTPSSGSGSSQSFSFAYSDPRGFAAIGSASIIINNSSSPAGGCYLYYARASNTLSLYNDAGTAPLASNALGTSATMQNSQCSVNTGSSSFSASGNNLTLSLSLSFLPAFAGTRNIYMEVQDGLDSGWQQKGTWTVASTGPPSPTSVTPSSGSGATQSFSFLYSDPRGYASISIVSMLFNPTLTGASSCYLYYARASNTVYLANDAGNAWLAGITLGGAGAAQNSQCSVSAAGSSASGSGNDLTVNLAMSFQPAAATKNVYMQVNDGQDSGWQQKGTWTVSAQATIAAVSVTPGSGSGSSQTFSFLYTDPRGYAAISSASMIVGASVTVSGVCYVRYSPATNSLYLTNDAGTAWQTPVVLGSSGTIQNSQCTVNAAGSSVLGSGNNLTVNVALTFKPAFTGVKQVAMEAYDGSDTGWVVRGTWTVP